MASPPIRIELRHLATEREDAQRDLQETLVALEKKLLPQRAVRRLVTRHNAALVLFGAGAVGAAIGFSRSPTRGGLPRPWWPRPPRAPSSTSSGGELANSLAPRPQRGSSAGGASRGLGAWRPLSAADSSTDSAEMVKEGRGEEN